MRISLIIPVYNEARAIDRCLANLKALEGEGVLEEISAIRLESTQLVARYAGRFDVKMKLNGDFRYDVRLMQAIREQMEQRDGENASGSMDLTRSKAVYSPNKVTSP